MDGKRVKERREELNLSQQELADIANVSLHTVFRTEKGTNIQTKNLQSIATALGVSVSYLMGEEQEYHGDSFHISGQISGSSVVHQGINNGTIVAHNGQEQVLSDDVRELLRLY